MINAGYFIIKKNIPLKTYRYAVCGGSNLILDTVFYFICFHFIFHKENIDLKINQDESVKTERLTVFEKFTDSIKNFLDNAE